MEIFLCDSSIQTLSNGKSSGLMARFCNGLSDIHTPSGQ